MVPPAREESGQERRVRTEPGRREWGTDKKEQRKVTEGGMRAECRHKE